MGADESARIDDKTIAAMQACIDHARALLESARAVQAAKHPDIAYHLATLALEEIGRRELIGDEQEKHPAYGYYIGGLTFLSLNDIHWQCESTVFGNFFECLKGMMKDAGDWKPDDPVQQPFLRFLDDMFPDMDERANFADLCQRFEAKNIEGAVVTLKKATFMKLFCDAYFLRNAKRKRASGMNTVLEDKSDEGQA